MISVEKLSKNYGDLRAVDQVSFEIQSGEIYGLLGPNGAGKTTTISMLSGLLQPDSGRVLFEGVDMADDPMGVKSKLGVVPQEVALYENLTATENLRFWGGLYGLGGDNLNRAVDRVLDQVGLKAKAKTKVKEYSGGMKRRLNLSLGLVHNPRIVMMDEPTVGIDPQARIKILDVVRGIAESGTTVLYTTHYLEEAEKLCSRLSIMDHGKILVEGTLDELKRMIGEKEVVTATGSFTEDDAHAMLGELKSVRLVNLEDGRLVIAAGDGETGSVSLLTKLLGSNLSVEGVSIDPPSLSSLFLKLTGRELRD
jgi:ABC-2 type transport system ATP-binding protein